jgi:hypothetical protein
MMRMFQQRIAEQNAMGDAQRQQQDAQRQQQVQQQQTAQIAALPKIHLNGKVVQTIQEGVIILCQEPEYSETVGNSVGNGGGVSGGELIAGAVSEKYGHFLLVGLGKKVADDSPLTVTVQDGGIVTIGGQTLQSYNVVP